MRSARAVLFVAVAGAQTLIPVHEGNYASTMAASKGKVVLVSFWATWCVPCRKELPELVKMAAKWEPKGLALVTVSGDEPEMEEAAKKFLRTTGVKAPTYIRKANNDDKFIQLVDPKWSGVFPALILYDRKGARVKSWFGETAVSEVETEVRKRL